MSVDIVSEQCRRILGHAAEMSVREKSRLDEGLESVADSEDETAACDESLDSSRNLLIVKDIGNELAASVRRRT